MVKTCSKCGSPKPSHDFHKNAASKDGLSGRCKDCQRRYFRAWREKQPGYSEYNRQAVAASKRKRPETHRLYQRRYQQLPHRRLHRNISSAVNYSLKRASKSKQRTGTVSLIGYTIAELKRHLEARFLPGMSWDNYGRGGWVIDHVKPISLFNTSDPTEFADCWSLSNLEPAWEPDNAAKGNRFIGSAS